MGRCGSHAMLILSIGTVVYWIAVPLFDIYYSTARRQVLFFLNFFLLFLRNNSDIFVICLTRIIVIKFTHQFIWVERMIEHFVRINGIEVTASYSEQTVDTIFLPFLEKLELLRKAKGKRVLAMLAAPPGAGKSTLLDFLARLSAEHHIRIQTIGMDGFHRRQEYLLNHTVQRDGKEIPMVSIKGAPVTFDLPGLTERIRKVAAGERCGWPVYDRLLHNPVEDAMIVDSDIVLLEGNYLLLDEDGWRDLRNFADYTISVRADETMLRSRLIDRRIKTGVERDAAVRFVDFSDMPNVRLCLQKTMPADLQLEIDTEGEYRKLSCAGN